MQEKHSFFKDRSKLTISLTIILLLICGGLFTLFTIYQTDKQLRLDLLNIGIIASKAIDTQGLSELTGTESDLHSKYYQKKKEQLMDMRSSDPNYRFIYLLGEKSNGSIFFYLDSEPPFSKDYSPPGQILFESTKSIKLVFRNGNGAVEGPTSDKWGKWVSVLVPVKDRTSGKVLAVMGIDIDVVTWYNTIYKNAGLSVGFTFIINILVIFVIINTQKKRKIISQQKIIIENEKKFHVIFQDSPNANLILVDSIIIDCNSSSEKLIGDIKNNIIGKSLNEFSPKNQPYSLKSTMTANEIILNTLKEGNNTFEWMYRRLDGESFWVEVSVSSLNFEGKSAQFVSWRDITQRKIAEEEMNELNEQLRISNEFVETNLFEKNSLIEELSETQEKLQKINSEKDKFFSIISHDLKSPFAGFLGLTKMMNEDISNFTMDEIKDISKDMQSSAINLYKLLENLLEWARMKRGVTEFNPEIYNLYFIVKLILEVQNEVAKQKEIEFVIDISEDTIVTADLPMLNTVLRNLISNAIKFTPRGGKIEIGTIFQPSEDSVAIYVKDSGIGMSTETISKLFRIDQKVSRPGTEGEPSTGLGLLICKEFVEKHGGKIRVESEEGKGSSFYFTLQ